MLIRSSNQPPVILRCTFSVFQCIMNNTPYLFTHSMLFRVVHQYMPTAALFRPRRLPPVCLLLLAPFPPFVALHSPLSTRSAHTLFLFASPPPFLPLSYRVFACLSVCLSLLRRSFSVLSASRFLSETLLERCEKEPLSPKCLSIYHNVPESQSSNMLYWVCTEVSI